MDSKLAQYGSRIFSGTLLLAILLLQSIAQSDAAPFAYTVGRPLGNTNANAKIMSVIDTATNSVLDTIPVGLGISDVALNPTGTRVLLGGSEINGDIISMNLLVIETASNTTLAKIQLDEVTCGGFAFFIVNSFRVGLAVNPQGTRLYVIARRKDISVLGVQFRPCQTYLLMDSIDNRVGSVPSLPKCNIHMVVRPSWTRL